jgi:hypothetical protein
MKDGPCMSAESDLGEATSKLAKAHHKIEDLRKLEAVLGSGQRPKVQKEIAAAIRDQKRAQEEFKKASDALEKCKAEHEPPGQRPL